MKPRITISWSADGELQIALNEAGRDLLVGELQRLSEASDHFHLGPKEEMEEVPLQTAAYRADDEIVRYAKVMFRPDHWDAEHFPHVLDPGGASD